MYHWPLYKCKNLFYVIHIMFLIYTSLKANVTYVLSNDFLPNPGIKALPFLFSLGKSYTFWYNHVVQMKIWVIILEKETWNRTC